MTALETLQKYCPATLDLILNQKGTATYILEAMRAFAKQKCKEQREICANHSDSDRSIDYEKLLNAPEPKFD